VSSVRRIAVGFDGSAGAGGAVRWSTQLAQQVGADIVVVHAVGLLEHRAEPKDAAALEATVRELAAEAGLDQSRVSWHLVDGDPCTALIRVSLVPPAADLLVVGSRGHRAHAGLLLGSTSLELAEHSVIPVVIVPSPKVESTQLGPG
jgi:nucleotide-binding universal stress UspA family protein